MVGDERQAGRLTSGGVGKVMHARRGEVRHQVNVNLCRMYTDSDC